jgi:protein-S-isoprenylcysteine O-methyltransferase Ste14
LFSFSDFGLADPRIYRAKCSTESAESSILDGKQDATPALSFAASIRLFEIRSTNRRGKVLVSAQKYCLQTHAWTKMRRMKATASLAAIVFFLQLPVPLYWLIFHPAIAFWRQRGKAVYFVAVLLSWGPVTAFPFRARLLRSGWPHVWEIAVGIALILFEVWIFHQVRHELGGARLAGQAELRDDSVVVRSGIYSRVRNPRYAGSFLAIVGACILARTRLAWMAGAAWIALVLVAVFLEERELRSRLGAPYTEYCKRVPRFFPFRFPFIKTKSMLEPQTFDSF